MRNALAILTILLSLGLSGCATGPAFQEAPQPPPGKALVYFMRPIVGSGSFFSTAFSVDDVEYVSLTNNGYSWVHLEPGVHRFRSKLNHADPLNFRMAVEAGRTYYIESREGERIAWDTTQQWLREIPADTARPIISKMRYTPANSGAN